jgi:hypothetical protein
VEGASGSIGAQPSSSQPEENGQRICTKAQALMREPWYRSLCYRQRLNQCIDDAIEAGAREEEGQSSISMDDAGGSLSIDSKATWRCRR